MSFLSGLLLKGIEHPKFTLISKNGHFEVRKYEPYIVAETVVDGPLENAGSNAFGILAGYINSKNQESKKISMTAPVTQQQIEKNKFAVQFMMPSEWTLDTLPKPNNPNITLKMMPARTFAVHRYNGGWSEKLFQEELAKLNFEIQSHNLKPVPGEPPVWARFNSPMAPWFMRTNDIMIPIY
jgi:hypothetical protein